MGVEMDKRTSPYTDMWNSEQFLDEYMDIVRFCPSLKTWFIWNGKKWEIDNSGKIEKLAQEVARNICHELLTTRTSESNSQLIKWARASLSKPKLSAMLDLSKPHVSVDVEELNSYPMLLNVENGVIDLKTGELAPHDKSLMQTKIVDMPF